MPYYSARHRIASSKHDLFWLPLLVAILCALAASALAAAAVSLAPEPTAGMAGFLLCPGNTVTTKLVTVYADSSTSRDKSTVLRCYNAQGVEVAGNGNSFTGLWWGGWMGMAALMGALVSFTTIFTRSKSQEVSKKS